MSASDQFHPDEFGRCDGCGGAYLMDGEAIYGYCRDPQCEGAVKPIVTDELIERCALAIWQAEPNMERCRWMAGRVIEVALGSVAPNTSA